MAMNPSYNETDEERERKAEAQRLKIEWEKAKAKWQARGLRLTQEGVAEELGMTQGAVSQFLVGRLSFSDLFLIKLSDLLEFDPRIVRAHVSGVPTWMAREPGADYQAEGSDNTGPARVAQRVPLISWVQAGEWQAIDDPLEPGEGHEMIECYSPVGPNSFALRVCGDSMTNPHGTPTFPDGTIIIVDPGTQARSGMFVIARLEEDEEATFKQMVVDAGQTYLKPLNPRYPIIAVDRPMRVCGVVRRIAEIVLV